jgi:hypothetical protein
MNPLAAEALSMRLKLSLRVSNPVLNLVYVTAPRASKDAVKA